MRIIALISLFALLPGLLVPSRISVCVCKQVYGHDCASSCGGSFEPEPNCCGSKTESRLRHEQGEPCRRIEVEGLGRRQATPDAPVRQLAAAPMIAIRTVILAELGEVIAQPEPPRPTSVPPPIILPLLI